MKQDKYEDALKALEPIISGKLSESMTIENTARQIDLLAQDWQDRRVD